MDDADRWRAVDTQRVAIADLLDDLTDDEWAHPSLCEGWTVRDVAAHLASQYRIRLRDALAGAIRARGNIDRAIHDAACAYRKPAPELVAEIRDLAGFRRIPPGIGLEEVLIDILVHGLDIALPLGRPLAVPPDAAAHVAQRLWDKPRLFHARRHFGGRHYRATDTGWSAGDGPEVSGPAWAIMLLFAGRPAARAHLTGLR
ncbi:maleylpyruvate isomerase family mycothiol-dependent enzyme [Amycolatopsis thermoflava]|uniref:maleylpyruvate isomerase family mycothiol-dependent enzyme n=1 Tax=Amycolatopsis thermoflava TaxID=84480 RepID=UPI00041FF431|nr:maleylpyruvate isomerase family mycothiol-dependent enzyme [Amycolatopsis thermoflava]